MSDQSKTVTREELYAFVWVTPMVRLAEQFGISGNGLAKICRRLDVPYPPRGWWAKKAAGHKVGMAPLPKARPGTPNATPITGRESKPDTPEPDLAALRAQVGAITVPERLTRAHPVIAGWRAERQLQRQGAARERDPVMRRAFAVPNFTEVERRMHRIFHALLRALEQQGASVAQGDRPHRLVATIADEKIEFEMREKLKQVMRPLTADEKRWRASNTSGVTKELKPSGKLLLVIHAWTEARFRKEWLESDEHQMESMLPDIAATLLAIGPDLAERRRQREEAERVAAEQRRREEEERRVRQRDDNRWRRFLEFAEQREQVRRARALIAALRKTAHASEPVDGRSISEWLDWAEARASAADPLGQGAERLFADIAPVTEWTYRG